MTKTIFKEYVGAISVDDVETLFIDISNIFKKYVDIIEEENAIKELRNLHFFDCVKGK